MSDYKGSSSDSEVTEVNRNRDRSRSPILKINKSTEVVNSENLIMAIPEFKFDYLRIVPEFTGNPNTLTDFITTSEQLINQFYNTQDVTDFQNILLLRSIKNKIRGDAANNLASYNITSWLELKNALLATYADKRDHQTLMFELCKIKQNQLKPLEFFSKIQENLNLQLSYISTHSNAIEAKTLTQFSQKMALRVFLKNLNNPLGDYLSTRNPNNLNEALHIITNDFNVNDKVVKELHPNPNKFATTYKEQHNRVNSYNPPRRQPNQTNVFKPRPNFIPSFAPTPMSTNTRNSLPKTNYFKNNSRPQNRYIAEELHNLDDINDQSNEEITEYEDYDTNFENNEKDNLQDDFLDHIASEKM